MGLHEEVLQIIRLTPEDAQKNTDIFCAFRGCIVKNSDIYPGISKWFDCKVTPEIASSDRIGYISCSDKKLVVATGLVKLGDRAKICHLSVNEDYQRGHIGEVFFLLMILEASKFAKEIHFTLPASLWDDLSFSFFKSFGFDKAQNLGYPYRSSEEELICSQSFIDVRRALQIKIPKIINNLGSGTSLMDCSSVLKMILNLTGE